MFIMGYLSNDKNKGSNVNNISNETKTTTTEKVNNLNIIYMQIIQIYLIIKNLYQMDFMKRILIYLTMII